VGAPEESPGTEPEVVEAVKLLLKLGADIDGVDNFGETAMHGAAIRNHPKVVQLLADKGATIDSWNRPDKPGLTPLASAEAYGGAVGPALHGRGHDARGQQRPLHRVRRTAVDEMILNGVRQGHEQAAVAPRPHVKARGVQAVVLGQLGGEVPAG